MDLNKCFILFYSLNFWLYFFHYHLTLTYFIFTYKCTHFPFTMVVCDIKEEGIRLSGWHIANGDGELLSSTPSESKVQHRAPVCLFVTAFTCCHNCPEHLLNARVASDWLVLKNVTPSSSDFQPVCCRRHTGVPQDFLKHAISDYLVSGTDLSSLRMSNKKNDNSQHNSHLLWMNQNHTYFFVRSVKDITYFWVCRRILVISLCAAWDEKVENHCHRGKTLTETEMSPIYVSVKMLNWGGWVG